MTVVGRDPLGREGINKSTMIEALIAYGRRGGGGQDVNGAGTNCCESCVLGYVE